MILQHKYYQSDLAAIHHDYYTQTAVSAAYYVAEKIKTAGFENPLLVDLGCGSGTLAKILLDKGCNVIGFDYSASMVAIAERYAPEGKFYQGSFLDIQIPACEVVTAIGEVFCYRFDEQNQLDTLKRLFISIYEALQKNGFLVFDSIEKGILGENPTQKRIIEHEDACMFLDYIEDRQQHTLERRIIIFKKQTHSSLYQKSEEIHRLMLYDRHLLKGILEDIGFSQVHIMEGYGDSKLRDKNYVLYAQK